MKTDIAKTKTTLHINTRMHTPPSDDDGDGEARRCSPLSTCAGRQVVARRCQQALRGLEASVHATCTGACFVDVLQACIVRFASCSHDFRIIIVFRLLSD